MPNIKSTGKMKIDDFLFDNKLTKFLNFSEKKPLLADLAAKCNEFAKKFIADEIQYLKSCGNMTEVMRFYNDLEKMIPENNSFFLFRK